MPNPCPPESLQWAGRLLDARITAHELRRKLIDLQSYEAAAMAPLLKAGAMEFDFARGLGLLNQAAGAPYLIAEAHQTMSSVLLRCGFSQPTNADLSKVIASIVAPRGGGGGGRGGGR